MLQRKQGALLESGESVEVGLPITNGSMDPEHVVTFIEYVGNARWGVATLRIGVSFTAIGESAHLFVRATEYW